MAIDKVITDYDLNDKKFQQEVGKIQQGYAKIDKASDKTAAGTTANMQKVGNAAQGAANQFKKLVATFGATLAAGMALKRVVQINVEFNKSIAELSAITGAVGKDLDFLKKKAKELSIEMGKSASDIAQAFKLVASAKPELLKSGEALAEVTKQAIILSTAAGIDLNTSVEALTKSLNQYNASAKDAAKFVNILAAGSKFGAGEVAYLAEGIKHVGTTAKNAKLPFELTTAAIEVFAEKGLEAGTAGRNFRNILVRLQSEQKNYTNGTFDLYKALGNLVPVQGDVNYLTKQFGLENINAVQALVGSIGRLQELQMQLTGTQTALEQYNTQTSTLAHAFEVLTSTVTTLVTSENTFPKLNKDLERTANIMYVLSNSNATLIDVMFRSPEHIKRMRNAIDHVAGATINWAKELGYLGDDMQSKYPLFSDFAGVTEDNANAIQKVNKAKEKQLQLDKAIAAADRFTNLNNIKASRFAIQQLNEEVAKISTDLPEGIRVGTESIAAMAGTVEDWGMTAREWYDTYIGAIDAFVGSTQKAFNSLAQLNRDNAEYQKNLANAQIVLNESLAIANAIASVKSADPVTYVIAAAAIAAAVIATFSGIKANADKAQIPAAPRFAEGVVAVHGPGGPKGDKIPSLLSDGETVVSTEKTNRYMDELMGMKNNNFEDVIFSKYVLPDRASFAERIARGLQLNAELNDERIVKKIGFTNRILIKNNEELVDSLKRRKIR